MTIGPGACLLAALILAGIGTGIVLLANRKRELPPAAGRGWQGWIGYIAIALVLSLWSVFIGLLFLGVVWVLRQNPAPDSTLQVGAQEKKTARRIYTWLFLSSFLTVPIFLILLLFSYSYDASNNRLALTALAPLLLHLPLLTGFSSKSVFVFRHTQQGIVLISLRGGLAALAVTIGSDPVDGLWIFLLGNGFLWLFGSLWGWDEVHRGACWWMKGKPVVLSGDKAEVGAGLPRPATPEESLDFGRWHLKNRRREAAKKYALEAFRHGDLETRRQAVQLLDDMNEVAFF